MLKRTFAFVMVTVAASLCLATAQNSKPGASATAGPDPLKTATKPLTPKSAIASPHKSSTAAPLASTNTQKTNAELRRLERQGVKTAGPSKTTPGAAKAAPAKPATASPRSDSGINAPYQKPRVPQK